MNMICLAIELQQLTIESLTTLLRSLGNHHQHFMCEYGPAVFRAENEVIVDAVHA